MLKIIVLFVTNLLKYFNMIPAISCGLHKNLTQVQNNGAGWKKIIYYYLLKEAVMP